MPTTQLGNTAGRDVIGRDKIENTYLSPPTSLSRLYQILRDADKATPYTAQIADQLQHYCNTSTNADVRGLKEKLTAGKRQDLIDDAMQWKQKASKLVMKWQTSPAAQDILTHILAKLHTEFIFNARPAIEAEKSREEVDEIVISKVIQPTHAMLGENDLGLTYLDLMGLLFFLGGNCHIRWDKC
ncbi:hypothetical protein FVQ98_05945 [Ottowia sp. GY511]|uniref:ABC-three component system protein n=1 Tax=Ottowia flava TaxID=2675430 RepID=A0ABW4KZW9_9BURK|nr:ABC-three component system protein [Ottowia sp. GY511]TXK31502.1 hypothetical protein FVQ98_05945 [Ottowia sp. GY511]